MNNNIHQREGSLSPTSKRMMSCEWNDAPEVATSARSNQSSASTSRRPNGENSSFAMTTTSRQFGPICNYQVVTSPGGTKRESFTLNGDLRSCEITFGDGKVVVKSLEEARNSK